MVDGAGIILTVHGVSNNYDRGFWLGEPGGRIPAKTSRARN